MPANNVNSRVQKHRHALRMAGLRPVQIWVPDTRQPNFAALCRAQSESVAKADVQDKQTDQLMDDSIQDVDGWSA